MSVTIKQLNGDASFLLTFRPPLSNLLTSEHDDSRPFTIILDPWLAPTPSDIILRKFASSRQKTKPHVSSLCQLQEPDLVVVSQNMTDHCHKETLTQMPSHLLKPLILGPKDAIDTIKSWKYFHENKLIPLQKWCMEKPDRMYNVQVLGESPEDTPGEVTITYLADKWHRDNMAKTHTAIAITYTPPARPAATRERFGLATPPDTPLTSTFSQISTESLSKSHTISIIFSPHGCKYSTLAAYTEYHLSPLFALPLTALLHCFDEVKNTWYLGGKVCNGMHTGVEIAQKLQARVWISTHDGDKEVTGASVRQLKIKKHERAEVESVVSPVRDRFEGEPLTRAVVLDVGEEITLGALPLDEPSRPAAKENIDLYGAKHLLETESDLKELSKELDRVMLRHRASSDASRPMSRAM